MSNYGVLVKLGRDIMTIVGLHFSATTEPDGVEEEVRLTTTTYKDFLQWSGDIEHIFDKESPFKLTVIALFWDKIVGYNLDDVLDSTHDRQQPYIRHYNRTMQIERAHFAYRENLELKTLYQHLTNIAVAYNTTSNRALSTTFPSSGAPFQNSIIERTKTKKMKGRTRRGARKEEKVGQVDQGKYHRSLPQKMAKKRTKQTWE
jgi:hypothetical protein